ncbi:conserved exported hypothetical protein [Vibrio nigripulchritudo SOn1]|uniref:Lysozyme inhibitor LprI N-terminal domain-containing protein n=1 Tax=Vibrio nigripulchritudo SOn1 TaxID=1238450 RepID=A0AAV2VL76_9VIBR|nr:hypothetical protein [Vibrio nigripulchritudo]CCO45115.1 conserved exported hypothetical protein [Vibrio nigripulchritudo SOn1]
MKKYLLLFSALLLSLSFAQTPDELLDGLKPSMKQWVERSCSRNLGPSLWSSCVNREVRALQGDFPNLSTLTGEQKDWLQRSCPTSLGPSLTISCYNREFRAFSDMPSLAGLTAQQSSWVQDSCSKTLGPSLYSSCLKREISAVKGSASTPTKDTEIYVPQRSSLPRTSSSSRNSYPIEVAHNDELFIINGEKFEAKTYCLGWYEGQDVIFVDGSPYGVCASATLLNLDNKETCEVWCE